MELTILVAVVVLILGGGAGFFVGYNRHKQKTENTLQAAETRAAQILTEAESNAKDTILKGKDEALKLREETERVLALDDREHLELAADTDEVRNDRVARLVGRDRAPLVLGVLDRLEHPLHLAAEHAALLLLGEVVGRACTAAEKADFIAYATGAR